MATANYSLKSLKIGDIANDGTMGTALTEFDDPVRDTCVLTTDEGSTQDFFGEINDDPYYSVVVPGKTTLAADFYAKSASQLQKVFGGGVTGDNWEAPATKVSFEQSIELTHQNGNKVSIIRANVSATFEWNFKRTALPLIHMKATILPPVNPTTGVLLGIGPMKYTKAV